MANRYTYQFRGSFEAGLVSIFAKISFGSSGAPTLVANQCKGIQSIVRNSTGNYTITLGVPSGAIDTYARLMRVSHNYLDASAPAAPGLYVTADNSATGSITIQLNAAGTATDPASGEVIMMEIVEKNSSV